MTLGRMERVGEKMEWGRAKRLSAERRAAIKSLEKALRTMTKVLEGLEREKG